MVIARTAAKRVQSIVPNQREWFVSTLLDNQSPLSTFSKANVLGKIISNTVRREQQWQCKHAHG